MQKFFLTAVFFVTILFAAYGCDRLEVLDEEELVYPVTIDTIFFSLPNSCVWNNIISDSIYLINSKEKLAQHITCHTNATVDIDLDNYSLIVLQPKSCNIDSRVEELLLQQISANKYLLSVDVTPGFTIVTTTLTITLLVPKIAETASVELVINRINENINPLIGTWREIYPYEDCSYLTFSDNDTIYHRFTYDNSVVKLIYRFISKDSIQIERLQESDTNPYTRKTNNKIVFYKNDSILIENYYVSDAAVFPPEFIDITLQKTIE